MIDLKKRKAIENYWMTKLSGKLPVVFLPFANLDEAGNLEGEKAVLETEVPAAVTAKLLELVEGSDIGLFIFFMAGLHILLYKYSGIDDLVVGTVNLREEGGKDKLLFCRHKMSGDLTPKEVVLEIKQAVVEAFNYNDYSFGAVYQKLLSLSGEDTLNIFNAALIYDNIQNSPRPLNQFDLVFILSHKENHTVLRTEYHSSLYDRRMIDRFSRNLTHFFDGFMDRVNRPISEIDILSPGERLELLDINKTDRPFPVSATIHELFEKQVEKSPHSAAAVFQSRHLTFSELNTRANQLAWVLRAKGVGEDTIVGLLVDRSPEMVVGMLGILKAGGAYLPIDPETPVIRIQNMLDDCNSSFLLTRDHIVDNYNYTALQALQSGEAPVHFTGPCRRIADFDGLGFPDRSLVDYEKYNRLLGQAIVRNRIMIQASRGCPHNCIYCYRIWPREQAARSAENILEEILLYYNIGIRKFDIFMLSLKEGKKLFQLIVKNNVKDLELYFPNGFRGDLLTREYIDLMVEAGTVNLALALETASPRLQKLIDKHLNLEKFRENVEYLCETYPHVILELFTMHGIPSETEEEARMTLDFIKRLKWVHFPYVNVLKIYQNTRMEKLALESGISKEAILESENLAWHEWSDTLPFEKKFTTEYQSDFLNEYILSKERLLSVLPYQAKILTEDELLEKYDSYLPHDIKTLNDLLSTANIGPGELGEMNFRDKQEDIRILTNLNQKLNRIFSTTPPQKNALRVLLLDLSQFFTPRADILYDVVDAPIGLMYLLTHLKSQLGEKVDGKILKSRIDFDSYEELKQSIEAFKPGLIGIRSLSYYKDFFHETVSRIRQWGIDVPIVTGGPYATVDWKTVLQDPNIDLAVVGEGETTFSEIVKQVLNNNGKLPGEEILKEIPGIAFVPHTPRASAYWKGGREILMFDQLEGASDLESGENLAPISKADNLAYVIYTSGSTGRPKGVPIEHRNAVNTLTWFGETYGVQKDTHVLQLSSYTFDPSVEQIFGTLLHGGVFYMPQKELIADRDSFRSYVDRNRIGIINFIPGALEHLLCHGGPLKSLTTVISGGEKLETSIKDRLISREYTLYNQYGPTETTIDALAIKCSEAGVVLGKPIANTRCYILGKNNWLAPIGVTGEIHIGGAGVSRGYLNNPELTADRFVEIPHLDNRELYRTGDYGRYLPNRDIEFLGRMDHQVKVNGYRIELGGIESQLLSHFDIREAVVTLRENEHGERYLCAYFVSDSELTTRELNDYLSGQLLYYMMPRYFVRVDRMPLTTSGKIDRGGLPDPEQLTGVEYIGPRDRVERTMTRIWGELLNMEEEKISIDANFFEAGGQSLKATVLMAEIHKEFNVKLTLGEIFKTPTIRGLAESIKGNAKETFVAIEPVEEKKFYFLSSAQKRLYILHQVARNPIDYNIPMFIPLNEAPDTGHLEGTLKKLIRRHESLRTSFHLENDEPVQRVHLDVDFEIEHFDSKAGGVEEIVENFVRSFDLSRAPLLRVGLFKNGDGSCILLVDMHHIISDGVSQNILEEDFAALYRDEVLPPLRLQYKDFAEWHKNELEKENLKRQEEYWLKEFKGNIPVSNIPTDYPRPETRTFEGRSLSFEIPPEENTALKKIALEQEATLFMVYLAITDIFLSKISGREDIVIGTPIAGRRHADLKPIVGMFVNTLALRNYPAEEKTFTAFLKEIKKRTLEAFENQDFQFEDLVEKVLVVRDPSRNPLFDLFYTFETDSGISGRDKKNETAIPGMARALEGYGPGTTKFDLKIAGIEQNGNLDFVFEYRTKLFKKETIERFISYFKNIISAAASEPNIMITGIEILDEEEKDRLIEKMKVENDKLFLTEVEVDQGPITKEEAEFDF